MSYDAVPDELKVRDQWLLWDSSNSSPRQPHWRGDFNGISWSNPDDWHSFEEACEAAAERETWGIGYVTAVDNTDYARGLFGVIDLDGCADSNGAPKDWVPGIKPFVDRDAYIEWSPSGTGLHIPVWNIDTPDWWSDVQIDDHEGVDVLTNKFCTFTGDCETASGAAVVDMGDWLIEWLADAYENITGETAPPRQNTTFDDYSSTEETNNDYDGPELTEEQVVEALDHVDEMLHFNDWIRVGFAVYDWDSGARGKRIFEEWSQSNAKSNPGSTEGQGHINDIWDNDSPNGNVSVGTLIHHAREGGWGGPGSTAADGGTSTDNSGGSNDEDTGTDADGDSHRIKGGQYAFQERNGGMGYFEPVERDGERDYEWNQQANFTLRAEMFLSDGKGNESAALCVRPQNHSDYTVSVDMTVFNNIQTFRNSVVTHRSTYFDASMGALNHLRKFVGNQNAPVLEAVEHIGRHGEEFVTSNGVLTEDGWADEPTYAYQETGTPIEQQWALDEEGTDGFDSATVGRILELLPQTREPDRFLPALGWWYASPFKPVLMDTETGQWPILNVSGETGAGKTSTFQVLAEAFGLAGEPESATGTTFPKMTSVASSNAVPFWIDEFKPAAMKDYRVDELLGLFRKATTNFTESRGNADGSSDVRRFRAPICVSGEQLVSGPAEERRTIQTIFGSRASDPESDMYHRFKQLVGESYEDPATGEMSHYDGYRLAEHAYAYIQWMLARSTDSIRLMWRDSGTHVSELLSEHDMGGLNDAVSEGFQVIHFGCSLYREFADEMGVAPSDVGVTDQAIDDAILHVANGRDGPEQLSHFQRVLDVASRAAAADYLEAGEHYKIVTPRDRDGSELRLKLPTAVDAVKRYARDYDVADGDLLDSAEDYRTRIQNTDDIVVRETSVKTYGLQRTVAIGITEATERIPAFEQSLWGDAADGQGDTELTPKQAATGLTAKNGALPRSELLAKMGTVYGIDPETADDAITMAVSEGRVNRKNGGTIEPV